MARCLIISAGRANAVDYSGVDINKEMISYCQRVIRHKHRFTTGRKPDRAVDFAVFVSTFNLCHTDDYALWQDYILRQRPRLGQGQDSDGVEYHQPGRAVDQ